MMVNGDWLLRITEWRPGGETASAAFKPNQNKKPSKLSLESRPAIRASQEAETGEPQAKGPWELDQV